MSAKAKMNEDIYQEVLNQCISLLKEFLEHEKKQILLAYEIGKNVDKLLKEYSENESVLKRFSREISKQVGKFFEPARFSQYRQLYLNFTVKDLREYTARTMNDIDINTLLKTSSDNFKNKTSKENLGIFIVNLRKIERLCDKLNDLIIEKTPDDEEISKIHDTMDSIMKKLNEFYETIKNKNFQASLFN